MTDQTAPTALELTVRLRELADMDHEVRAQLAPKVAHVQSTLERTLRDAADELDRLHALPPAPEKGEDVRVEMVPQALPAMQLADGFGDSETLLNSRDWLTKAVRAQGAQVTGGGCGLGGADIDIVLEGFKFNIRIEPK